MLSGSKSKFVICRDRESPGTPGSTDSPNGRMGSIACTTPGTPGEPERRMNGCVPGEGIDSVSAREIEPPNYASKKPRLLALPSSSVNVAAPDTMTAACAPQTDQMATRPVQKNFLIIGREYTAPVHIWECVKLPHLRPPPGVAHRAAGGSMRPQAPNPWLPIPPPFVQLVHPRAMMRSSDLHG